VIVLSAMPSVGQPIDSATGTLPGQAEHDPSLKIQVDRSTFRAFEPIYLAVSSRHFLTDAVPELSIWQGTAPPAPIVLNEKAWMKVEAYDEHNELALQRNSVLLQLKTPAATAKDRVYLFPTPGDYNLRVRLGNDAATLKLKILPTEAREKDAWDELGNNVDGIVNNAITTPPEQKMVNLCTRIMRSYPGTTCAGFCQAYMSISKFKLAFQKSGKSGGKDAYASLARELNTLREAFSDSFMAEQLTFYAGYALGLTHDFNGVLAIDDELKTHVTPFSDGVDAMRLEILQHTMNVIPVDPSTKPTTAPSVKK
jgi:hypothetical protein